MTRPQNFKPKIFSVVLPNAESSLGMTWGIMTAKSIRYRDVRELEAT